MLVQFSARDADDAFAIGIMLGIVLAACAILELTSLRRLLPRVRHLLQCASTPSDAVERANVRRVLFAICSVLAGSKAAYAAALATSVSAVTLGSSDNADAFVVPGAALAFGARLAALSAGVTHASRLALDTHASIVGLGRCGDGDSSEDRSFDMDPVPSPAAASAAAQWNLPPADAVEYYACVAALVLHALSAILAVEGAIMLAVSPSVPRGIALAYGGLWLVHVFAACAACTANLARRAPSPVRHILTAHLAVATIAALGPIGRTAATLGELALAGAAVIFGARSKVALSQLPAAIADAIVGQKATAGPGGQRV